jgi:hypothetical protein
MPHDECLNMRLGDYFHQRRDPIPAPAGAAAQTRARSAPLSPTRRPTLDNAGGRGAHSVLPYPRMR